MEFSIARLIEERQADQFDLHRRYTNPSLARVLEIIGFDKQYVRGEGAYLWDVEMIVSALDEVLSEAEHIRGRVWSLSGQLIKHALARRATR